MSISKPETEEIENMMLIKWFFVGTAIMVLMMIVYTVLSRVSANAKVEKQLYANYQKPQYEGNRYLATRDPLDEAKYLVDLDKFKKAKVLLQSLVTNTKDRDTLNQAHLYLSHVYVNLGDIQKARKAIEECNERSDMHDLLH